MRQDILTLVRGHVIEMNFVIMKFMQLPDPQRRRIHDVFIGGDVETKRRASLEMLTLITNAESAEFVTYVDSVLGLRMTDWFIWNDQKNMMTRAVLLERYFTANLKLEGGRVSIDPLPIKPVTT